MGWAEDLVRLTEKGGKDLGLLCRAIKVELFSGVVSDTRVDTGRLRGNWQIQEDSPAQGEVDRLDKTAAIVHAEIEEKATASGITYFTNNLPYAVVYEEKDAMVARNALRVQSNINKMANRIK